MPPLLRESQPRDHAIFAARRAFNAGFLALETELGLTPAGAQITAPANPINPNPAKFALSGASLPGASLPVASLPVASLPVASLPVASLPVDATPKNAAAAGVAAAGFSAPNAADFSLSGAGQCGDAATQFDDSAGGALDLALDAAGVWGAFEAHLGAAFAAQNAGVWLCALHPAQRGWVARLFCVVALAKMQLDPHGDPLLDASETRLWSAALSASPRAVAAFEAAHLAVWGELGFGFAGVKHRLGDLYRRAGRCDNAALRLYIEVFTGRRANPVSRGGAGDYHSVALLLERGAALSMASSDAEIAARYSLCLLLQSRGWSASWVARSLQIAREKAPATLQNWRERAQQNPEKRARQRHREAQKPEVERLIVALSRIAAKQFEAEAQRLELQRAAKLAAVSAAQIAAPQPDLALQAATEPATEPPKPRRKRGRPRKVVQEVAALETALEALAAQSPLQASNLETVRETAASKLSREALAAAAAALKVFESETLESEAAVRETEARETLAAPAAPKPAADFEPFIDFDTLFGEAAPLQKPDAPASESAAKNAAETAADNDWLSFDFGFDKENDDGKNR